MRIKKNVSKMRVFRLHLQLKVERNSKNNGFLLNLLQCDLKEHPYDEERLNQFCQEHGFIGW